MVMIRGVTSPVAMGSTLTLAIRVGNVRVTAAAGGVAFGGAVPLVYVCMTVVEMRALAMGAAARLALLMSGRVVV